MIISASAIGKKYKAVVKEYKAVVKEYSTRQW
jgi:hypothetical protein